MRDPYLAGWNDATAAAIKLIENYDGQWLSPTNISVQETTVREILNLVLDLKKDED